MTSASHSLKRHQFSLIRWAISLLLLSLAAGEASSTVKKTATPLATENPSAPLFGQDDASQLGQPPDGFQRLLLIEQLDVPVAAARVSAPQNPVCSTTSNAANMTFGFSFRNDGNNSGLVQRIGNRIDVREGFACSLTGAWYYFGVVDGDIDGEFSVWIGAGGIPTSMVANQVINSTALAADSWNFIDWESFGLTFTDDFYVAFGTVLGSGITPDDRIQAIGDVAPGSHRVGVTQSIPSGGWFLNRDFWSRDVNFAIDAVVCCEEIPFTNCELQTDADSYAFIFPLPSSQNCRTGVGMRFETGGFDTLVQAEISLTDLFSGLDPDGEVTLELLADNGSGIPDPGAPLAPPLVIGGPGLGADLYPLGSFGFITYPLGEVTLPPATAYHITLRWTGNDLAGGGLGTGIASDNYQAGEGDLSRLASVYFPGTPDDPITTCVPTASPGWNNYFSVFGILPDFLISIFTCRDEFIDCELAKSCHNADFSEIFDETEGFTGFAAAFQAAGDPCRVDEVAIGIFSWEGIDGATLSIHADNNGFPGAALASEFIDTLSFPFPSVSNGGGGSGFLEVFPNAGAGVEVPFQYHVVLRPLFRNSTDANRFIRILLGDGTEPVTSAFELDGTWVASDQVFIDGNNVVARSHHCCLPFGCRCGCTTGDDWPTYQKDQSRSGRSTTSLGAANCNLSLLWSAASDKGNSFSGSVITNGIVYISDDGGIDARDALSGALLWDQDTDPTVSALFANATGVRTQPTIASVDTGAIKLSVAFLGTGLNRDVIAVSAFTGEYLWHNTSNAPFPGLQPITTNIKSVVINDGIDAVLIYATRSKVYAVLAASGDPYPGWSVNPVVLSGESMNAISSTVAEVGGLGGPTDLVFVPTFSGGPGNIHALNFMSGAEVWNLAGIVGNSGLEAARKNISGYLNNEGFLSGAAYDPVNDVVWANSAFDADFPAEGYLYRIAVDGSSYHAEVSVSSRRATPMITSSLVYVPAFSKWEIPRYDGIGVFAAKSGRLLGGISGRFPFDRQFNDGILTCESGEDRWLVGGTELGQLQFTRVGNQNEMIFYRETTNSGSGAGSWAGGSLADDLLVFTTLGGITVALGPQPDRPRLSILNTENQAHVFIGAPPATPVIFENVFSNSGCADLVIDSIRLSDTPNFSNTSGGVITVSSVSPTLARRMSEVANYTTNASVFHKIGLIRGEAPAGPDPFSSLSFAGTESELNYIAASAFPDVVTAGAGPDGSGVLFPAPGAQIAPGDSADLVIAIEGPAVTRGPHTFYATLWTSDPDYFLDNPAAAPEVALTVIGGCLEDSVRIHFGAGGANSTTVYNDGLVGRFPAVANDIDINGYTDDAALCGTGLSELFAGLRGFSLTPRRIAMTGPSWEGGDDYRTILGDLNYCSNTCQPQLQANVLLGAISHDKGLTYDPVFGDLAATTYIDSAQDYSAGTGVWDTRVFPDILLNDSTIGIIVNETHYGAIDIPELADFRLIRLDVTNRSATDSIVDLHHLAIHDDDIGTNSDNSIQGRPKTFGYAYGASPGAGIAHGYIRVPSGCGLGDDIMRVASLNQTESMWNFEETRFYDSIYQFARLPQFDSIHFQEGRNTFRGGFPPQDPNDATSLFTFGRIDLAPSETKSFAIAQFVKVDCANLNPGDDNQFIGLADMVNKWAGFHRGDVNNDLQVDLLDIVYLANIVAGSSHGAFPFAYLSDVNNDAATDMADLSYLVDFYFNCGPCPVGDWTIALCNP